jgi:hypothetical protein
VFGPTITSVDTDPCRATSPEILFSLPISRGTPMPAESPRNSNVSGDESRDVESGWVFTAVIIECPASGGLGGVG